MDDLAKYAEHGYAPLQIFRSIPRAGARVLGVVSLACSFAHCCARCRRSSDSCTPLPDLPMAPGFPNRSVVYTELSCAEIGMWRAKTRPQTLQTALEWEKRQFHLPCCESKGPITLMHHLEVKPEVKDIKLKIPEGSVGKPGNAMNTSITFLIVMYLVSGLYNIDSCMLIKVQER